MNIQDIDEDESLLLTINPKFLPKNDNDFITLHRDSYFLGHISGFTRAIFVIEQFIDQCKDEDVDAYENDWYKLREVLIKYKADMEKIKYS